MHKVRAQCAPDVSSLGEFSQVYALQTWQQFAKDVTCLIEKGQLNPSAIAEKSITFAAVIKK